MDKNIIELINTESFDELRLMFTRMNAVDIADVFEHIDEPQAVEAFRLLENTVASEIFSYISQERQHWLVGALTDIEVEEIMEDLPVDDMVDLIEEAPEDVSKRVLENVSPEKSEQIDRILDYPEDSAGSVMTTEVVELKANMTANDALHTIRSSGVDKETIYTCYVIDDDRKLIGVVTADTLLYAPLAERVGNLMDTNVIYASAGDDREEVTAQFTKYDLIAMPVVNRSGQLVGIVTIDDILRVMHEEDTEDFEQMVGILNPTDEPYMKSGVFKHAKNRIVWLLVLMLTAAITGAIIATFEDYLAVLPVLVVFIPVLMGTGGNAGAQTSTVIIRGMAIGEIEKSDIFRLIWRETRIALVCSVVLGVANFVRVFFMYNRDYTLAIVVSISLCITLVVAKSIGCILPVLAKALKLDPSIMVAPLITTIVDCTSLIVFFVFARMAFNL